MLGIPFPNPFNPTVIIPYSLANQEKISLSIINILGEHILVLEEGNKSSGLHHVYWDGKDNAGKECPTGMYFVIFKTPSSSDWEKILFVQ